MIAKRIWSRWAALIAAFALVADGPALLACGDDPACACQTMAQTLAALSAIEVQGTTGQTSFVDLELVGNQEFLREALESSTVRVQLGQLAAQKSQSDDIRHFSEQMVRDDTDLTNQVILRVARLLSMDGKKDLSKKDKQLVANLENLSGAQFDQQFLRVMLKDHQQDLKKFKTEMTLTQNRGVKVTAELGTAEISQRLKSLEQMTESHSAVALNQSASIPGR
jgi:predicted outer membrane protein